MRRILPAIGVAVFFGQLAQAAELDGPLQPAAKGQFQCLSPDPAHKTCKSMIGYRISSGKVIESIATVLISGSPLVTMDVISAVEISDGRVCGQANGQDVLGANFTVDGRPAEMKQSQQFVQQALATAKPLLGRYICRAYLRDGDTMKAKVNVDGAPRPDMDQAVSWVSLDEGYKVSP
jgi:hypothetical protein